MSTAEIYVFSGTGNSLAVARDLAGPLGARLIPVASVMDQPRVQTDADVIGLVFPIYDFKPPKLVDALAGRLDGLANKYVFAVCTYGITVSDCFKHLDGLLRANGGRLAAGWAVAMPHNGIGSAVIASDDEAAMFVGWKRRAPAICAAVEARQAGPIETSTLLSVLRPRFFRVFPYVLKLAGLMIFRGVDSLALTAGTGCNGCGACERVCPAANIQLEAGRPVWLDHCAGCFACLHWCPRRVISLGGREMGIRVYHHPEIRLADMLRH